MNTCKSEKGTSTDSNSDSGLPIPIIAGAAAGGAVLFLIILFCVVFLYCKQLRKKKAYPISTVYSNADGQFVYKKGL